MYLALPAVMIIAYLSSSNSNVKSTFDLHEIKMVMDTNADDDDGDDDRW